jgi:hypothetical protein
VQGQRRRDDCEQALSGARAQTLARSREAKAQLHRAQTRSTSLPRKAWHRCYFQSITTFVRSDGKIVVAGYAKPPNPQQERFAVVVYHSD